MAAILVQVCGPLGGGWRQAAEEGQERLDEGSDSGYGRRVGRGLAKGTKVGGG